MMKVLLVEPHYYTKYPPLGLMKLASYHRSYGNEVKLIRGINKDIDFTPDRIEITSLFTYAWKPVHEVIEYYHVLFPNAKIRIGGIYASLMPDRLHDIFPYIDVQVGIFKEVENYLPAYDILNEVEKWRKWDSSIVFTTRGCIRKCPFCMVPRLEGKIKSVISDIKSYINPDYKKIILWDNNFLASPNWKNTLNELHDLDLLIDFNQGLDARLINEEKARMLADLRVPLLRFAFDDIREKTVITKTIDLLSEYGLNRRKISVYILYNFYDHKNKSEDNPSTFFKRIKYISKLGCVSYPMRFEPLDSLEKNQFVSPLWNLYQLEMIAKARRVIGFGGAFPPYEGLIKKFGSANTFEEAFELYPMEDNRQQISKDKKKIKKDTKNQLILSLREVPNKKIYDLKGEIDSPLINRN